MKAAIPLASLALAAVLFLSACGGGDGSGEATGIEGPTQLPCPSGTTTATFSFIQTNVFDPRCVICHSGAFPPQGLSLESPSSLNIVGTPSSENNSLNLIEPFDPDASYLIKKVRGDPDILGVRMPANGPPYLDDTQILTMEDWVCLGAITP